KHLKNIFQSQELNENSACAIFAHTASDGKKYKAKFCNLDAIISVGYRVNSAQGTEAFLFPFAFQNDPSIDNHTLHSVLLFVKSVFISIFSRK
ncbi:MAG TPA: hypothetical protein PKK94_25935, partial [Leptospiraceae bacterium]|nr:hypothetical protein [Leptospiraceae bacterium]